MYTGKRIQRQRAENHCSGITINPRDLVRRDRKRHGIVIVFCPDALAFVCVFKHYFIYYYYTFFFHQSRKKYVDKPYITPKPITSLHLIVIIRLFTSTVVLRITVSAAHRLQYYYFRIRVITLYVYYIIIHYEKRH